MKWMLDTDVCITLIRSRPPELLGRLRDRPVGDVAVSVITVAELMFGVENSSRPAANRAAMQQFLIPLAVLPFDTAAAGSYGALRAELLRRGQMIGAIDLMIAGHALSEDAMLITRNLREFARVPGLRVEDWNPGAARGGMEQGSPD